MIITFEPLDGFSKFKNSEKALNDMCPNKRQHAKYWLEKLFRHVSIIKHYNLSNIEFSHS